ncbi:MAG TPA: hypothetical protein VNM69_00575 [Bacillus sp. (in: firmicutes)]|uniref:hypothetical protein n=1 Tax=Bacillus litorisediminis TaxID=2922713 RepID=UPI001FAC729C|nr:hypothetical protein [Bacillus litorisediminis]HWO74389.1 hypothetical protein [Bacillus sp. (in: firmicutes)]
MHNADSKKVMWIVVGIIVSLSSLVLGLLSNAVKQTIFMPGDAFFFGSDSVSAMISIAAGFALGISIILAALELKNKKLKWGLFTGLFSISLVFLVLTIDEYYYYSPDGIFRNELMGFGTEQTKWEDVALITSEFQNDEYGTTYPKKLYLELKNGEVLEMNLSGQLSRAREQIDQTVRTLGGDSIIRILDQNGEVIEESLTEGL